MALNLEVLVDDFPGLRRCWGNDGLVEVLQDEVVQLPERKHVNVVVVHKSLDRELATAVLVAKKGGELSLVIEAQLLLGALGQHVQAPAHLPEKVPALKQRQELIGGEETEADQVFEIVGAVVMPGHPAQHLDIPKAPGAIFDVGLEVVLRVVVALVALVLFPKLGVEKGGVGPKLGLAEALPQLEAQALGADQGARFQQVGHNGNVLPRFLDALVQGANAVSDGRA